MNTKQLREKAVSYGLSAMTDAELCKLARLPENYLLSHEYKAFKELQRREIINHKEKKRITSSRDARDFFSHLENLEHEEFHILYLNRNNRVILTQFLSKGNEAGTVVNIKEILKQTSILKASGIILAHNHPSGNMDASGADKDITIKIKKALELIDSKLLDHLIIGEAGKYYSFSDEGMI